MPNASEYSDPNADPKLRLNPVSLEKETLRENNPHDVMVVCNIDKEDFTVKWDGNPYTVEAGCTRMMPRFLAVHFAKHLIDCVINRTPKSKTSDQSLRESLGNQIIVGLADEYVPEKKKELPDVVNELNVPEKEEIEEEKTPLPTKRELLDKAAARGLVVDSKMEKMKVADLAEMLENL